MLSWVKENRLKLLAIVIVAFVIYSILILQFPRNQLLTDDELKTLITEKGFKPTLVTDLGKSYTAILYKDVNSKESMEMIAYKNRWNNIITKQFAFYNSQRANKVDVEYWSTEPYEYNLIGYVGIEILNKEIFDEAKSVKVVLDNGLVERADFADSNILLVPATRKFFLEKPRLETIEIYDENGNVIDGFRLAQLQSSN